MIKEYIRKVYRFYYISQYYTTMYETKTATEISIGFLVISCLVILTSIILYMVLKISSFWGIHIGKDTLTTAVIIMLLLNILITGRLAVKYITQNIIDPSFIDSIEKDAKKYSERTIWLKFILGNILVFFIFLLTAFFCALPIISG